MTQDARNFIFSSDYPLPTYAKVITYQMAVSVGDTKAEVETGLDFTPLTMGVWSTTQDFSVSYDITLGSFVDDISYLEVSARGSKIIFDVSANAARTVYFKIYCMIPPDSNESFPPVADSSNFMFSTDYNYLQIAKAGRVFTKDQPVGINDIVIYHNLGYIPKFRVWSTATSNGQLSVAPRTSQIGHRFATPRIDVKSYIMDSEKLLISNYKRSETTDDQEGAYYQIYTEED
jgi:hypothetical protein